MKNGKSRQGDDPVLRATGVASLRSAVERLRAAGLSAAQAAAEVVRENIYDWVDGQTDAESNGAHRLRIVKR